ncbi:MAG: Gldg family protein [Anaerolineales bacterium]
MNNDSRRYAPLGLLLSGLSFLAILGTLTIRAFERVGLYLPANPELLDRILYIGLGLFIAGFAIYTLLDPDRVRRILSGRQARYGSNSFVMLLAFLGILVIVNLLVYQNPQRWDITEDKQHTLAPETIEALNALPQPVLATAFYSQRLDPEFAREIFDDYKANSNGNFNYTFVDPEANPLLAQEHGITGDGKILLQMGETTEIVTFASEEEITAGLIRLLNPQTPSIYFLTGEGEHDIENPGDSGFTRARTILENKNYVVKTLSLQASNSIPEDAEAIVIAGPIKPLTEEAVALLDAYLAKGGGLIVMINPVPFTQYGERPEPLTEYLAESWGISLENNIVVDTNSPSSPYFAVSYEYGQHPITQKMSGVATIYPFARSLSINEPTGVDVFVTPLVYTVEASWGETDFTGILEEKIPSYDPESEQAGPMLLAAAAENGNAGRLVVFGNSPFAQDSNFDFSGNGDMLVNSVDWVTEQETLIDLSTSPPKERIFLPPSSLQLVMLIVSSLCLIPLVVIGAGIYTWFARRKRG